MVGTSEDCVLVTGGCGFVGRHLIRSMINSGEKIVIIDDLSNGDYNFVKSMISNHQSPANKNGAEIVFYKEDIRNERAVLEIVSKENVQHCIHLAAKISVKESFDKPHDTIDVNVDGTLNVLRACSNNHVRSFVFASSAAVYGDAKHLPAVEGAPMRPKSPYGASKVAGEALVCSYSSRIKSTFGLRFFNIYGEGKSPAYSGVIASIIARLANRLPPIIYGDGNQTRDFVFIDDVVKSIMLAKNHLRDQQDDSKISYSALNIGTGRAVSVNYLVQTIQRISGLISKEVILANSIDGDITHSYSDIYSAEYVLGFIPSMRLEDGLERIMLKKDG